MAPSNREERQLMRQRGAGTRKIDSIDFGFSFNPTPGRALHDPRKNLQSNDSRVRRSSGTPSRGSRAGSTARSTRDTSVSVKNRSAAKRSPHHPWSDAEDVEGPSELKRRKISDIVGLHFQTSEPVPPPSSTAQPSGSLSGGKSKWRGSTSGPSLIRFPEDQANGGHDDLLLDSAAPVAEGDAALGARDSEDLELDKENMLSIGEEEHTEGLGSRFHRKPEERRFIGQQSGRRTELASTGLREQTTSAAAQILRKPREIDHGNQGGPHDTVAELQTEDTAPVSMDLSIDSASMIKKKRKKRKSIGQNSKKRRRSSESNTASSVDPTGTELEGEIAEGIHEDIGNMLPVAEELSFHRQPPLDTTKQARRKRSSTTLKRSNRASDTSHVATLARAATTEPEPEGDETYINESVFPEPLTPEGPARKTRSKSRTHHSSSPKQPSSKGRTGKKTSKSTYPIQTYRLANVSTLPTIAEELADEHEHEQNHGPDPDSSNILHSNSNLITFPNRPTPNAVDVLGQICREEFSTASSKILTSAASGTSSAEVKRKRSAVEAFASELDSRLFDMSAAVEDNAVLYTRLKMSGKEKLELQTRWFALKRQREEVALKCDEVRRQHWEEEAKSQHRLEMNDKVLAVEMAVERQAQEAEEDLEFMLRSVAKDVSSAEDGGGLLDKAREFNRQLERMAMTLEGRAIG